MSTPSIRAGRRAPALALSLGIAALAACSSSATRDAAPVEPASPSVSTSRVALGDTVRVIVGQAVSLDDGRLTVGFTELVEETRCPANAMCVWQGNGAVRLRLEAGGRVAAPVLNTSKDPRTATHAGYGVELVALWPYPGTEPENARLAKSAIVRVVKR